MEDNFDEGSGPNRGDKPKRVSKKKIEEIPNVEKPKSIVIYHRAEKGKALMPFMNKFSRETAITFSETIERELSETGTFFVINDKDPEPYKQIFEWMNSCVAAGNDIPFPDIEEPADDGFGPIISIMMAASKLRIPDGSLNAFLKKRLYKIARNHIMSLDTVRKIYDPLDLDFGGGLGTDLQEIATISILEGWFSKKLEEDEYEDYMYELSDLRDDIAQLDENLHTAVVKKQEFFKQLREKRKMERMAAQNVETSGGGDFGAAEEGAAGWSNPGLSGDTGSSDWNSGAPTPGWMATDSVETSAVAKFDDFGASNELSEAVQGGGTWADEVNEEEAMVFEKAANQFASVPSSGW